MCPSPFCQKGTPSPVLGVLLCSVLFQVWPESIAPMQEVGRLVLNANPKNKFNDDMQLGFSPARIVPGALCKVLELPISEKVSVSIKVGGFLPP